MILPKRRVWFTKTYKERFMSKNYDENTIVKNGATRPGIKYYSVDDELFDVR